MDQLSRLPSSIVERGHAGAFDVGVFVGRFQPFHYGHLNVVKIMAKECQHIVILIGSANRARVTRNPFTYEERQRLITMTLIEAGVSRDRFSIYPLPDYDDNVKWISTVQHCVHQHSMNYVSPRVGLFGHMRDATSAYLRWFPQWQYRATDDNGNIHATHVRHVWMRGNNEEDPTVIGTLPLLVPALVHSWLEGFKFRSEYTELRAEERFNHDYKKEWGQGPHVTVDAVIFQSSHVLTIRRKKAPGAGKFAVPGGHLELGETIAAGTYRELTEETAFPLSYAELMEYHRATHVFDDPHRSMRARVITNASYFVLPSGNLYDVRGGDDAETAFWMPISEVRVDEYFEDHAFIIERGLKVI